MQDGIKRVQSNLASRVKKGVMSQKVMDAAMARLHGTLSYDDFKGVDLVRLAWICSFALQAALGFSTHLAEAELQGALPLDRTLHKGPQLAVDGWVCTQPLSIQRERGSLYSMC